jgi:DNA-binding beta-propeller fold protein YncE
MEICLHRFLRVRVLSLMFLMVAATNLSARAADRSFIGAFQTVTQVSSTVPSNGDVNPYGVARVPRTTGSLVSGRFLISNFNNSGNAQGTGTTIVQIAPDGTFSLFAQIDATKVTCPGGIGLTTALVALRSGFVVVGSLPTADGSAMTAQAGCLIVLDSKGNVVETFFGPKINGPWDMTAVDGGFLAVLFVTNVLNGTVAANGSVVNGGTVVRLLLAIPDDHAPVLIDSTIIASGFPERTDPAALVIGPTGVAFDDETGLLYVADSLNNRIAAIPRALFRIHSAGTGSTVSQGGNLNDPLGLALAPNHHILTANGNDGNIVETSPFKGKQVAVKLVDSTGGPPPGAGALFGLIAVSDGVYFVDDASNTFNLLH